VKSALLQKVARLDSVRVYRLSVAAGLSSMLPASLPWSSRTKPRYR